MAGLWKKKALCLISICRFCAILETLGVAVGLEVIKSVYFTLTEDELFCRGESIN